MTFRQFIILACLLLTSSCASKRTAHMEKQAISMQTYQAERKDSSSFLSLDIERVVLEYVVPDSFGLASGCQAPTAKGIQTHAQRVILDGFHLNSCQIGRVSSVDSCRANIELETSTTRAPKKKKYIMFVLLGLALVVAMTIWLRKDFDKFIS